MIEIILIRSHVNGINVSPVNLLAPKQMKLDLCSSVLAACCLCSYVVQPPKSTNNSLVHLLQSQTFTIHSRQPSKRISKIHLWDFLARNFDASRRNSRPNVYLMRSSTTRIRVDFPPAGILLFLVSVSFVAKYISLSILFFRTHTHTH